MAKNKKEEVKTEIVEEVKTEILYKVKFKCNVKFSPEKKFDRGEEYHITKKELDLMSDCVEKL